MLQSSKFAAALAFRLLALTALFAGAATAPALAHVARFEIRKTSPAFAGQAFGETGAYEIVEGTAYFEVDPALPVNALIANIQRAPRNARGMVEFDSDIVMLRPADPAKGNGRLFYEPVNRGTILSLGTFNGGGGPLTEAASAGDGFLMKRGFTLVYAGWQPSYPIAEATSVGGGSRLPPAPGRLMARLPVARATDGSAITQKINVGATAAPGRPSITYLTYPAADVADKSAVLRSTATGKPAADATWRYIDEWRIEVTSNARGAFDFVYEAKDPVVYGLSLVSMRDFVSFLRYDESANNPARRNGRNTITKTIGYGASQTGRTIKNLIYHFNDDEKGRIVFDGAHIHISGASLNSQNVVFGQPGQKGGEAFPYTYETLYDPLSRRTDGWLMRCSATRTCPKVIHTDSEAEGSLAGSLVYTDTLGKDVKIPDNVRVYLISGTQHSPAASATRGACENLSNPMPYRQPVRALLMDLDDWITTGKAPPASRHPKRGDGSLVSLAEAKSSFPKIPGFSFSDDFPPMYVTDPASGEQIASLHYPVFRPKTDKDGNTVAGIHGGAVQAPLGTYTGWNPRPGGEGSCPALGSFAPFARTKAERTANGDPRLSLEERYASEAAYVATVRKAAQGLVKDRLMLADDVELFMDWAAKAYRAAVAK